MLRFVCTIGLVLIIALTGSLQGYRIISGSRKMVELFGNWHIRAGGMGYFGSFMLVSVVLSLFPETFVAGNLLLALAVLWLIYLQFWVSDHSGAALKALWLAAIVVLVYLDYPVAVCGAN